MKSTHGFLIRFIDLGLLLLMAFLATADLASRLQVPLPHGTGQGAVRELYRIRFDESAVALQQEPYGVDVCQGNIPMELAACLLQLDYGTGAFLVTPTGAATVQRLVEILDVCQELDMECSIAP